MKQPSSKKNCQGKTDKPTMSKSNVIVDMTPNLLKISGVSIIQTLQCSYDRSKLKREYLLCDIIQQRSWQKELWKRNGIKISHEKVACIMHCTNTHSNKQKGRQDFSMER